MHRIRSGAKLMRSMPAVENQNLFSLRYSYPKAEIYMIKHSDANQHLGLLEDGGTMTVLLVDDEEAIRGLVAPVLRRQGFTVLEAADGVEAMSVAERHVGPIHLLLTDWCMPRLTGGELILRLSKGRPETAILVISGEMYVETLSKGPVLRKPFKQQDLIDAVSKALNGNAQGTCQPLQ